MKKISHKFFAFLFVVIPVSATESLVPEKIFKVGLPSEVQIFSLPYIENQKIILLYDSYPTTDFSSSKTYKTLLSENTTVTSHEMLFTELFYTSITGMTILTNNAWLYLTTKSHPKTDNRLLRVDLSKPNVKPEIVTLDTPYQELSSRIFFDEKHGFFMIYRNKQCCGISLAASNDGIHFNKLENFAVSGFMPSIASFDDGTLVTSYQSSFKAGTDKSGKNLFVMKSRYKLSKDGGISWSDTSYISDSVAEVHDAFPFRRLDGNIDFYYVYGDKHQNDWSMWRRCLRKDGTLGQEQKVTTETLGNVNKPYITRLPDNRIYVSFVLHSNSPQNFYHDAYAGFMVTDSNCDH